MNVTATFREIVSIIITADSKQAVASIRGVGAAADKDLAKAAAGSRNLGDSFLKTGALMVGAGAAIGVGLASTIRSAQESERAQLKLQNTIKNSPKLVGASIEAFNKQATAIQNVTVASDEQVTAAQAMLGTFHLTETEILKLTPLIVDYARKFDTDLVTAAKQVGKAMDGQIGALQRNGIIIDKNAFATNRFNAVLLALRENAGGFATQEGKTFDGQMQILANHIDDFKESVGRGALSILNDLLPALNKTASVFVNIDEASGGMIGKVAALGSVALIGSGSVLLLAGAAEKFGGAVATRGAQLGKFASKLVELGSSAATGKIAMDGFGATVSSTVAASQLAAAAQAELAAAQAATVAATVAAAKAQEELLAAQAGSATATAASGVAAGSAAEANFLLGGSATAAAEANTLLGGSLAQEVGASAAAAEAETVLTAARARETAATEAAAAAQAELAAAQRGGAAASASAGLGLAAGLGIAGAVAAAVFGVAYALGEFDEKVWKVDKTLTHLADTSTKKLASQLREQAKELREMNGLLIEGASVTRPTAFFQADIGQKSLEQFNKVLKETPELASRFIAALKLSGAKPYVIEIATQRLAEYRSELAKSAGDQRAAAISAKSLEDAVTGGTAAFEEYLKPVNEAAARTKDYTDSASSLYDAGFAVADSQRALKDALAETADESRDQGEVLQDQQKAALAVASAARDYAIQQLGPGATAAEKTKKGLEAQQFALAGLAEQYPALKPFLDGFTQQLNDNAAASQSDAVQKQAAISVLDALEKQYPDLTKEIEKLKIKIGEQKTAFDASNITVMSATAVLTAMRDAFPGLRGQIDKLIEGIKNYNTTQFAAKTPQLNLDTALAQLSTLEGRIRQIFPRGTGGTGVPGGGRDGNIFTPQAQGGPVRKGQPLIVGEAGSELFLPASVPAKGKQPRTVKAATPGVIFLEAGDHPFIPPVAGRVVPHGQVKDTLERLELDPRRLPHRATGGKVRKDSPAVVGEQGAELFVPADVQVPAATRPPKSVPARVVSALKGVTLIGAKGETVFTPPEAGTVVPHGRVAQTLERLGLRPRDVPRRADGGPVKRDEPAIVGERGQELFVPRRVSPASVVKSGTQKSGVVLVGSKGETVFTVPEVGTIVPHGKVAQTLARLGLNPREVARRSKGGPVRRDVPSVVGETGPELFVPAGVKVPAVAGRPVPAKGVALVGAKGETVFTPPSAGTVVPHSKVAQTLARMGLDAKKVARRALGGRLRRDETAVVGEQGPELWVPGSVVPPRSTTVHHAASPAAVTPVTRVPGVPGPVGPVQRATTSPVGPSEPLAIDWAPMSAGGPVRARQRLLVGEAGREVYVPTAGGPPLLVGRAGPELFTPPAAGQVFSHPQAERLLRSTSTPVPAGPTATARGPQGGAALAASTTNAAEAVVARAEQVLAQAARAQVPATASRETAERLAPIGAGVRAPTGVSGGVNTIAPRVLQSGGGFTRSQVVTGDTIYNIDVKAPGNSAEIGKAIVESITAFEKRNGKSWRQ